MMEKKSNSYKNGLLDSLAENKVEKITKFTKEYIKKKFPRSEKHGSSSSSRTQKRIRDPTESLLPSEPSPDVSRDGSDQQEEVRMEDVFDMGDDDIDNDNNMDIGEDEGDDEKSGDPSPASDVNGQGPGPAVTVVGHDVDMDEDRSMDVDSGMHKHSGSDSYTSKSASSSKIVKIKRSRWDQRPSPTNFDS